MTGSAVWNNDGDTVMVLDPEGFILRSRGYGASAITTSTSPSTTIPPSTTSTTVRPTTTATTGASPVVYITSTGTKYHRDGCRYLANSKLAITLVQANAQGYTPCGVCRPPT